MKERSKGKTAVSISLTQDLLDQIDARAEDLELPRSRYLAAIAQIDIARGGPITISTQNDSRPELTPEALEFLKYAVPAAQQFQDNPGQCPDPVAPEDLANTDLWKFFLKQRGKILDLKWCTSSNARQDIGMERALIEWLHQHPAFWAPDETEPSV